MTRCCRALILAAVLPGAAQTAVMRVLQDRDSAVQSPPARLFIVDAKGSHVLADGFAALLASESLQPFQLPVRRLGLDSLPAKRLLAERGLPPAPQWLLVDTRTEAMLARGAAVPLAAAFAQTLEQAGFLDRAKALRAYLKHNPQVIEAHEQLLYLLRARGEAAAQRDMGLQVPSAEDLLEHGDLAAALGAGDDPARADLQKAKKLDPVHDLIAWSGFSQEFDTVFRTGQWREMDFAWTLNGHPVDAASPTLQGLYLRWLPAVEGALREDPTSESLWSLWIWMSQTIGGDRLGPLLASLQPSPLTPRSDWPPPGAVRILLASARTPGDWRTLQMHFQSAWEEEPHELRAPSSAQASATSLLFTQDWDACLGPLLECALRSGDTAQADAWLRGALEASRWEALPGKAAALAAQCGQRELASRWAALRPGGGL